MHDIPMKIFLVAGLRGDRYSEIGIGGLDCLSLRGGEVYVYEREVECRAAFSAGIYLLLPGITI